MSVSLLIAGAIVGFIVGRAKPAFVSYTASDVIELDLNDDVFDAAGRALYEVPADAAPWASWFVRSHSWRGIAQFRNWNGDRQEWEILCAQNGFRHAAKAVLVAAIRAVKARSEPSAAA